MNKLAVAFAATMLVISIAAVLMWRELRGQHEELADMKAQVSALEIVQQARAISVVPNPSAEITNIVAPPVAGTQAQESDTPPEPWEDPGACPFEGCVYREWIANEAVEIHADRKDSSPVAFRLKAGESVTAVTGMVVTLRAGRVRFNTPQRLDTSSGPIDISPEQTLYLLTYQGEGYTKAWFNGKLYSGVDISRVSGCEGSRVRPCLGEIVEPTQREWWVQVKNKSGQVGWTQEPAKFDNKDALG